MVIASTALMSFSDTVAETPLIANTNVSKGSYPSQQVTFPHGVQGRPGIVYSERTGFRPLTLDLYLPGKAMRRPPNGFPLIVYMHGGGWAKGNARQSGAFVDFPAVLAALSARGYVVASIEYRLSGEVRMPGQEQDAKAAIRWLRKNAADYAIDGSRTAAWGVSAGGHLAALTAVSCGIKALEPLPIGWRPADLDANDVSDCVQGAVVWYGIFDMATITDQAQKAKALSRNVASAPEWTALGCIAAQCKHGEIELNSPVSYVDHTDPPMLLIAGDADRLVPYAQTLEMADRLKAEHVRTEAIIIPGVDHGLIGSTPEATRAANLQALNATFRFFDGLFRVDRTRDN